MVTRLALFGLILFASQTLIAQTSTITGGNWNNTATWVGGVIPVANATVVIDGPVTLDVNSPTLTSLTINSGKTFTTSAANTLTVTNGAGTVIVNGTFQRNSTGAMSFTAMIVNSGGTYVHNVNNITLPTATWNDGSICNVSGVTGNDLAGENLQSFHHFTWSSANTVAVNITPTAIAGDLNVTPGAPGRGLTVIVVASVSVIPLASVTVTI